MKSKFKIFIALFLFIGLFSCSNNNSIRPEIETLESSKTETHIYGYDKMKDNTPDIVDNIEIIKLEETDNSLLSSIRKIEKIDSVYVIWDDLSGILCFNSEGKFLNSISKKGEAGNEYMKINCFLVDSEKSIVIFDDVMNKMLKFKLDGTFISSHKFKDYNSLSWMHSGAFISDNRLFQENYIYNDFNDIYTILSLNNEDKEIIYKTPLNTASIAVPIGTHPISKTDGGVKFIIPFDNNIYTINNSGNLETVFNIVTDKTKATEKELSEQKEYSVITSIELSNKGYFQGFTDVFETNNHILLAYYNLDYMLINKITRQAIRFNNSISEGMVTMPFSGVISTTNDYFISVYSISDLEKFEKIKYSGDENINKLKEFLKDYEYDSNPFLIVYKLKNDITKI